MYLLLGRRIQQLGNGTQVVWKDDETHMPAFFRAGSVGQDLGLLSVCSVAAQRGSLSQERRGCVEIIQAHHTGLPYDNLQPTLQPP